MEALLDADIPTYRIGFAAQTTTYSVYLPDEEHAGRMASFDNKTDLNAWLKENLDGEKVDIVETIEPDSIANCLHSVRVQIEEIIEQTGADKVRVFLTGTGNFREKLVDYYKQSRDHDKRPFHYENIRKYLIDVWDAEIIDGMEADDACGINQTENTIICSDDKDLLMIPGYHYNIRTKEKQYVDEVSALRAFYGQLVSGDSGDDIPGIYKITGKKATKKIIAPLAYIEAERDMWEYVLGLYGPEHEAKLREIGKLLWIKRTPEDDWEPPK